MFNSKAWYASKTIWTIIVTFLVTIYSQISSYYSLPAVPELVYVVLSALGIYARVSATAQIGSKPVVPPTTPEVK
jgi:hypothetical protein